MIMDILRGGKAIWLNSIVAHIPSWTIRKGIYKLMGMKIGEGARIGIRTHVSKPENIAIGARSVINQDCLLDGRGGIRIGEDVSISQYSKIITESHISNSATFDTYKKPVEIKDRAWLGMGAMILLGSVVGENSIIGAGCVFKGKGEKNAIMAGNPARHIGTRALEGKYKKDYKAYFI